MSEEHISIPRFLLNNAQHRQATYATHSAALHSPSVGLDTANHQLAQSLVLTNLSAAAPYSCWYPLWVAGLLPLEQYGSVASQYDWMSSEGKRSAGALERQN